MPLANLVIDLDSFFASVEQQLSPHLRGKPLGVVPVVANSTCCIAASKEAKRYGVKTGTPVLEARAKCPEIQFVEARPTEYVELHEEFIMAVEACIPVEKVLSIDEVGCRLDKRQGQRGQVEALCREIKSTVKRRIGDHVTCSIGAAPNHFLAKLASDIGKPNGLFIIEQEDLPQALAPLKLRDFCGIGPQMEKRLLRFGIQSVSQLTAASRETLHHIWGGIGGVHFWHWLRGEETHQGPEKKRVLGHSHVLPPKLRHDAGAKAVLHRLLQKAATRLRKGGLFASSLEVSVKFDPEYRWRQEVSFGASQDTLVFLRALEQVWASRPHDLSRIPTKAGVTLYHLEAEESVTPELLSFNRQQQRLNQAMDLLNRKQGQHRVIFGGAFGAMEFTPMRIAFTRIPDRETEK